MGNLFIISAPSGAGKTSIVRAVLTKLDDIATSISHTTRAKRPGEGNHLDYHFVDQQEFARMVENDEFLEHAAVFEKSYGTSWASVNGLLDNGIDVILEIDWQGALQVRRLRPKSISIFVLPPSKATLRERLVQRGQDDEQIINNRMAKAVDEMSHFAEFDFLIVNDDFDQAVNALSVIVQSERLKLKNQQITYQHLIKELLP